MFFRNPLRLRRRARRNRMAVLLFLLFLLLLLLLPFYIFYKPPAFLVRFWVWRWPDVLWAIPLSPKSNSKPGDNRKILALTIDDAPSEHTREILDVLEANNVHATFFVIGGQVPGREEVLADIVRGGHELGNHGMHDEPARALPDAELESQIHQVEALIDAAYATAGRTRNATLPSASEERGDGFSDLRRYYRPGSGFFSDRMRALVTRLGFRLVLGSIYPHDAHISTWWVNAAHILSMARPGGIIICHDRRSWTPPMLRRVLPELVGKRGYDILTLSDAQDRGSEI